MGTHTHACKHKLKFMRTHLFTRKQAWAPKSIFFSRMCVQGNRFNIEVGRSDKLSLPGFENLTAGYNKFLRPNFGGRSSFLSRTSVEKDRNRGNVQRRVSGGLSGPHFLICSLLWIGDDGWGLLAMVFHAALEKALSFSTFLCK